MRSVGRLTVRASAVLAICLVVLRCAVWAADPAAKPAEAKPAETKPVEAKPAEKKADADKPTEKKPAEADTKAVGDSAGKKSSLTSRQQELAESYRHLEDVLLRMGELSAATDPRRAALLKKAIAQSKEQLIGVQFEQLVKQLDKEQYAKALENQAVLDKDLQQLLELLLSENREKRLESEKARIGKYLKEVNELIKKQKSLQGRTASAADPKPLSGEQRELADRTGRLADTMRQNENGATTPPAAKDQPDKRGEKSGSPDKKPEGQKPGEGKSDAKPGEGKPEKKDANSGQKSADGKSGDRSSKSSKSSKGYKGDKSSKSQKGSPSQDKPPQGGPKSPEAEGKAKDGQKPAQGEGAPSDSSPPEGENADQQDPSNPTRQKVEQARRRMIEAEKRLEEAKQKDAFEAQEQALRELEEAKAQLEEILRQLREEEMQRMLTMLEARFRKMLNLQREVLEGTVRIDKTPEPERNHDFEIESGRLASKEGEIVVEVDKALLLLRDDGTAVAFPEAATQMRQDMQQVATRLAEAKTGKVTQSIEEEIIASLEEMIDALKKAQKKLEDKKQRPSSGGGGQGEPPLVDVLSELKMIRALQMRINSRTERYSKLIDGEQAEAADLVAALRELAQRQSRVYQITRELESGRGP